MTKRYRLTARAQMHGEVREPGFVFTLGDGELGPHRTVSASSKGAQIADHIGADSHLVDEPLYVALSDDESAAMDAAEAKVIEDADAHAEACAAHAAGEPSAEKIDEGGASDPEAKPGAE